MDIRTNSEGIRRREAEWGLTPGGRAEQFALLLSLALAAGLILLVGIRWNAYQWDFHMFYGSAQEFAVNVSPYRGQGLSYYHPPVFLYVYGLFTLLPLHLAIEVWYVMKVLTLAGLFAVWHRHFVKLELRASTILFFTLAYGAAIYCDLRAGNVSIFEELLLWFGFSRFLQGRYLAFSLCVIAAAQVKLTPIYFAGLLIAACERPQWRMFFATLAGFVAVFSVNYLLEPELFRQFWMALPKLDERGSECISFLALIRDVSDLAMGAEFTRRSILDELAFFGIVGIVGALSLWAWLEYRRRTPHFDQRLLICFSCVVFVLVSPRVKDYTYILMLVPTLYLVRIGNWRRYIPLAVVLMAILVFFPQAQSPLPFRLLFAFFNSYLLLWATFVIWIVYLDILRRNDVVSRQTTPGASSNRDAREAAIPAG